MMPSLLLGRHADICESPPLHLSSKQSLLERVVYSLSRTCYVLVLPRARQVNASQKRLHSHFPSEARAFTISDS